MVFYSVHFNRPDFIEIQKKCIDRIGANLVIINNGNDNKIDDECQRLGVRYYRFNGPRPSDPSGSHATALNFTKTIIDYDDDWCLIDHDIFPTKEIDLTDYDIISILQTRGSHTYLWPGFIAARKKINIANIDFFPDTKGDTGSNTSELINDSHKINALTENYLGDPINGYYQNSSVLVQVGDLAIHYMNGSGWMPTDGFITLDKNKRLLDILGISDQ